jgi:predicted small lipoprotein YifL
MVKTLALLIIAGSLAACGSNPKAPKVLETPEQDKGCYQADWQAETNPVINKRSGPDGLDKYETQTPAKEHGCP